MDQNQGLKLNNISICPIKIHLSLFFFQFICSIESLLIFLIDIKSKLDKQFIGYLWKKKCK